MVAARRGRSFARGDHNVSRSSDWCGLSRTAPSAAERRFMGDNRQINYTLSIVDSFFFVLKSFGFVNNQVLINKGQKPVSVLNTKKKIKEKKVRD